MKLDGYDTYTNIELDSAVRGIIIYVSSTLSDRVTDTSPVTEYQESLWLKLRLTGNDSLIIGCIYRSPSSSTINDNALCSLFKHITAAKNQDNHSQRFIDAVKDSFLHQHVTQPTRHRYGQQARPYNQTL